MFSEKSFWTSANIFCRECENHFLKFMRTICVGKQNVHMVSPMWKIAEEKKNQPMEKFSFSRKFIIYQGKHQDNWPLVDIISPQIVANRSKIPQLNQKI